MENTPYQNKIDDLAISVLSVYRKIPVYWKIPVYIGNFGISVLLKKSYRQTDIGFNTGIFGIPVYQIALLQESTKCFACKLFWCKKANESQNYIWKHSDIEQYKKDH